VLWTLRQPRYAALAGVMSVIAVACVAAGTWQISRFEQSLRDNHALDANAHAAAVPLTTAFVPLANDGPEPGRDAIRFRTVTASGTYMAAAQQFLRNQSLDGTDGFDVVDPLRTATGVLLVVRGFVAGNAMSSPQATITPPPSGLVQITGRLQTTGSKNDAASHLGNHEIDSINPAAQAARLGVPVYDTYVTLDAHQPGASGVSAAPAPDVSNPAGGVVAPQHFAYVIQWYLFALLALAAPFVMGRHEVRDAQQRFLGIDPGSEELGIEPGLDRRLQLTEGVPTTGVVAVTKNGTVERAGEATQRRWQRAARLADRYGRSLGVGHGGRADQAPRTRPTRRTPTAGHGPEVHNEVPNSRSRPNRSNDAYHGSYNDYLWQLALADGATPSVSVPRIDEGSVPTTLPNSTPQRGRDHPSSTTGE
jgi:cytochrome oxidase assembly protein ShyY1